MRKILALSALLALAGCTQTLEHTQSTPVTVKYETYVKAGQTFPITQFTDTQGQNITLEQGEKRKLVILFATWCSDSQRTIAQIMSSPLASQPDLQIVGIGREENKASLDKFAAQYEVNFPLIADENRAIYRQFANAGVPRLILLDEQNQIRKTLIGEDPKTIDAVVW